VDSVVDGVVQVTYSVGSSQRKNSKGLNHDSRDLRPHAAETGLMPHGSDRGPGAPIDSVHQLDVHADDVERYACEYQGAGCEYKAAFAAVAEHERTCAYRRGEGGGGGAARVSPGPPAQRVSPGREWEQATQSAIVAGRPPLPSITRLSWQPRGEGSWQPRGPSPILTRVGAAKREGLPGLESSEDEFEIMSDVAPTPEPAGDVSELDWVQMSEKQRRDIVTLGWDEMSWNAGEGHPYDTPWAELSAGQQRAAMDSGFKETDFGEEEDEFQFVAEDREEGQYDDEAALLAEKQVCRTHRQVREAWMICMG
jgi:hypothetical protein